MSANKTVVTNTTPDTSKKSIIHCHQYHSGYSWLVF